MKIITFFCFITLTMCSCQSFLMMPNEPSYQEISRFGKEVKETYNLLLVGVGGGSFKGIKNFNLTFMGKQTPTLNEARMLFYDISTKFLERINANEKLMELALDESFSIANLNISIMFPNVENYITDVGIEFAFLRDPLQYVCFFTYDADAKKSNITYKEPYEELKKIVEEQRGLQNDATQLTD